MNKYRNKFLFISFLMIRWWCAFVFRLNFKLSLIFCFQFPSIMVWQHEQINEFCSNELRMSAAFVTNRFYCFARVRNRVDEPKWKKKTISFLDGCYIQKYQMFHGETERQHRMVVKEEKLGKKKMSNEIKNKWKCSFSFKGILITLRLLNEQSNIKLM